VKSGRDLSEIPAREIRARKRTDATEEGENKPERERERERERGRERGKSSSKKERKRMLQLPSNNR
jgi:hypothetical protein